MSIKQEMLFAAAPGTERGKATLLSTDPKGKLLVYPAGTSVVMRSVENPIDARLYSQHKHEVTSARISPSSYYCASGDREGNIRIWATNNEDLTLKLETRPITGRVKDIAWCPESKRIVAVGDGSERFALPFNFDTGVTIGEIIGHAETVNSVDIKPTRPYRVVTGGDDKLVNFYEGPPFKFKSSFKEHTNYVNCVRYSPDGSVFLSVSSDKKIHLFDGKTGEHTGEIPCDHTGSLYQCSFNSNGSQLLTTSADKSCKLWDVKEKTVICTFKFENTVDNMQVGGIFAGDSIISLSLSGDLTYLDPANPDTPKAVIRGHSKPITSMAIDAERGHIYTSSATDSCILRWALDGSAERVKGKGHTSNISAIAVVDGNLMSCGMDDQVCSIDAGALQYADSKVAVKGGAQDLAAIPGAPGTVVVVTSQSLFVIKQGQVVSKEDVPYTPMKVASAGAGHIAVGGKNKTIHLYALDGDKLTEFQTLTAPHSAPIQCLAYNAQGNRLASGDSNSRIVTWAVDTCYKVENGDLVYHSSAVKSLSFSPSGKYLVSGGLDCMVIVWDLETGKKVSTRAHHNGCNGVGFLGEDRVVTCGADASVRVWSYTA